MDDIQDSQYFYSTNDKHQFVVGLHWTGLLTDASAKRAVTKKSKQLKSSLVLTHQVNSQLAALRADEEVYGFFIGKPLKKVKFYSLASLFARQVDEKDSILVMAFRDDSFIVILSINGRPVFDGIVQFDTLLQCVADLRTHHFPDGAKLYLAGDWQDAHQMVRRRLVKEMNFTSVHDHNPHDAEPLPMVPDINVAEIDPATLLSGVTGGLGELSLTQFIVLGVLLTGAYLIADEFLFSEPPPAPPPTPDELYKQAKEKTLSGLPGWNAAALAQNIAQHFGNKDMRYEDWKVTGIACTPKETPSNAPANTEQAVDVHCELVLKPATESATMDQLAKVMPKARFTYEGNVTAADDFKFNVSAVDRDPAKLMGSQDFLVQLGSEFKRINDAKVIAISIKPPTVVGTINQTIKPTVPFLWAGSWSVTGPIGFVIDAAQRLPKNFALSSMRYALDAEKGDSFSIEGSFFVKE